MKIKIDRGMTASLVFFAGLGFQGFGLWYAFGWGWTGIVVGTEILIVGWLGVTAAAGARNAR